MPQYGNVVKDQRLSNLSEKIFNKAYNLTNVLPVVKVKRDKDTYAIYGKESFDIPDTKKGRLAEANEVTWTASSGDYHIQRYALKTGSDKGDIEAADSIFDLRTDNTELVMDMLMLDREKRIGDQLTTNDNYTNVASLAGSYQWSSGSADITAQVLSGHEALMDVVARTGNTLIVAYKVHNALRENSVFRDRLGTAAFDKVLEGDIKKLLEIENYVVSKAQYNSANLADDTTLGNYVFGDHALLAYVAPSAGRKTVSLGYQFVRKMPETIRFDAAPGIGGEYVQIEYWADEVLTEEKCGYLFDNAI